jgi:hypothetical protein
VPCIQIAGLALFVFAVVCLRFGPQAIMLEGLGAGAGLERSWHLAKPYVWRVLGIVLLVSLLNLALTTGPTYLLTFGAALINLPIAARSFVAALAAALVGILYLPIQLGVETWLYYDLRVRREGLDLEMELDALTPSPALLEGQAPAVPMPAPREPFLVGRDWRNLAIIAGGALALVALGCLASVAFSALLTALIRSPFSDLELVLTATPMP